jgi:hypothetical protein
MSIFNITELHALLIHIPKTGGASLRKGVFPDVDGPYYGIVPDSYRSLYKFTFVREPIERFLSVTGSPGEPNHPASLSTRQSMFSIRQT